MGKESEERIILSHLGAFSEVCEAVSRRPEYEDVFRKEVERLSSLKAQGSLSSDVDVKAVAAINVGVKKGSELLTKVFKK